MKINVTLRQAERLSLIGVPVKIQDGAAKIGILGAIEGLVAMAWHWGLVESLRDMWIEYRAFDKSMGNDPHRFWESYRCIRYQTRLELGEKWFGRG